MAVTPAEKVRRFVDVGIGGDGSAGDKEEGRVRTSQDFRVRSSPPVGFVYGIVNKRDVERKGKGCGYDRMGHTSVHDISIPILPRGDPRFVFVRVPPSGQYVACFSGLDEDNLTIREGDHERVVVPIRARGNEYLLRRRS